MYTMWYYTSTHIYLVVLRNTQQQQKRLETIICLSVFGMAIALYLYSNQPSGVHSSIHYLSVQVKHKSLFNPCSPKSEVKQN